MLINIDPLLGPELLSTLRAMGHGEEIVVVDRNYPALTSGARVIRAEGSNGPQTLDAILSVLPVDKGAGAVTRMEVRDRPDELLPVLQDLVGVVHRRAAHVEVVSLQPAEFKAQASKAAAIVVTGEPRGYGNIIIRKGTAA